MADKKGGGDSDDELWSTKLLDSLQKEHDKALASIRSEGRRLERDMSKATSKNASSRDIHSHSGSNNPFSVFKQFVDDGFDALTSGIAYIPSKIVEWDKREWEKMEEKRAMWRRWLGTTDPHASLHCRAVGQFEEADEAYRTAILLLMEAYKKNAHVPVERMQALYRDSETSTAGHWYPRRHYPAWLSTNWFKQDPYSPFQLEAQPDLASYGYQWRAAFEDLMDSSLGKPMSSEQEYGMRRPYGNFEDTRFGPGLEWMLSLQSRGVLPPLLPSYYSGLDVEKEPAHHSLLQDLVKVHAGSKSFARLNTLRDDIQRIAEQVDCKATIKLKTPETEQEMYETWQEFQPTGALDERQLGQALHSKQIQRPSNAEKEAVQNDDQVPEQSCAHESASYGSVGVPLQDYQSQSMLLKKQYKQRLPIPRQALHPGKSAPDDHDAENDDGGDEELWFAEQMIWDALDDRDVEAAKKVIDDWYDRFGDIQELFEEHLRKAYDQSPSAPAVEWLPIWNAAVCRSKLPEYDLDKEQARSSEAEAMAAVHYQRGAAEKYRAQLQNRYAQLAGHTASEHWSNEQMEKMLARLEQEYENLEQLTGSKKVVPATDTSVRNIDVLSALTTTYTTRLPDGTVTTKIVLKQRFADGREETTESVHTTNENIGKESRGQSEEQAKLKKKGWFWS